MQVWRAPLCALILCWIVISTNNVDAAKSNGKSGDIQRKNSRTQSRREELPSEDVQMDEADVEKENPKSKKSPEEVLAGKYLRTLTQ